MSTVIVAQLVVFAVLIAWDVAALYLTKPSEDGAPVQPSAPTLERALRIVLCTLLLAWTAVEGGAS